MHTADTSHTLRMSTPPPTIIGGRSGFPQRGGRVSVCGKLAKRRTCEFSTNRNPSPFCGKLWNTPSTFFMNFAARIADTAAQYPREVAIEHVDGNTVVSTSYAELMADA